MSMVSNLHGDLLQSQLECKELRDKVRHLERDLQVRGQHPLSLCFFHAMIDDAMIVFSFSPPPSVQVSLDDARFVEAEFNRARRKGGKSFVLFSDVCWVG